VADSFFTELKKRNVFKVGIAYLVLAWVVVQVTQAAVPALNMPEWMNTVVFFLGIIGFPFAIFFAWAFEVTPDGIKKESDVAPEDSISSHTSRKLDFTIIGLLVLVAGYFIYESRFQSQSETLVTEASSPEIDTPKDAAQEPEGSSIAVLPFVNMSSEPEQEYFSDGISEEILNVLAKIPKLHVTSRSSAFSFKGSKINISEVAKKLGVTNVLEGSVRKAGNRIRITAQLIEAGSDKHLWSETYDRELTDIFAVQDEISAAIVEALKAKLGLEVHVAKRDMSNVNLDAHNEYLKGRFYIENRNKDDVEKALAHFEKAIVLAPDYAPSWMGKGWSINFLSELNYGNIPLAVALKRARPAIEKALQLDPNLPEAYGILGLIEVGSFENEKAIVNYKKAIALNPNYADVYSWYSNSLFEQPKMALELIEKAVQLSPMSILANNNYAYYLIAFGRLDEAREVAMQMLTINDSHAFPYRVFGLIQRIEGRYAEAAISFNQAVMNSPEDFGAIFGKANSLAAIGLHEQAGSVFEDSVFNVFKYLYRGNTELFISQSRELYPRNENDLLGLWIRALAEAVAENHIEAAKYFKLTKVFETESNAGRVYSYQQVGENEAAQVLLNKAKAELTTLLNANIKYFHFSGRSIEIGMMEIAYLEGDLEKAIASLKQAMKKKYIIEAKYKGLKMYKKLREHPEWSTILLESDRRAAIQRELYLKLVLEKEITTL
jgi:TolB-like protein/Flp pilus assembly protein TadD